MPALERTLRELIFSGWIDFELAIKFRFPQNLTVNTFRGSFGLLRMKQVYRLKPDVFTSLLPRLD